MTEPSLEHGPNPALSAQPGVDAPSAFSQPEYSPGADPHAGGLAPAKPRAQLAKEAKAAKAAAEAEEDDEEPVQAETRVKDEPAAESTVERDKPADHSSARGRAGHRP